MPRLSSTSHRLLSDYLLCKKKRQQAMLCESKVRSFYWGFDCYFLFQVAVVNIAIMTRRLSRKIIVSQLELGLCVHVWFCKIPLASSPAMYTATNTLPFIWKNDADKNNWVSILLINKLTKARRQDVENKLCFHWFYFRNSSK